VDLAAAAGDGTPPTDRIWCLTEVDIFRDLSAAEMAAIAAAAPMKTYAAGEILYSPHSPVEALFILRADGSGSSASPRTDARSPPPS
jgi:hypothetical protein